MVVIGIVAIVLAMGVPPFVRSLQKDSLRQAVSDIEEACGRARAQAILRGVPTELIIRAADGQLTVAPTPETRAGQTAAGGDSTEQPADSFVPQSPVFSAQLHEDIGITRLDVNLKDEMDAEESGVHVYLTGTTDEFPI